MVKRSIAGGGVNCKCINGNGISGESNSSSVNGGKITVEFTIYEAEDKVYITNEDASNIYKRLYDAYPTKYIIERYELQNFKHNDLLVSERDTVIQHITVDNRDGKSDVIAVNILQIYDKDRMMLQVSYIDGELEYNTNNINIGWLNEDSTLVNATVVNNGDPKLESAYAIKYSLTLYYRER